ncbi:purine and uridine phosphorylase [Cenococcum geophilum 1.58]|uniref:purine and uridine phosphorylase n=1 Tax=Cenococcum geophilum 1.58 TaxID=794803 RepID=UPI00358E3426|nr:purine and uridine phosphorylase [Cenococcum geophilum 1.58]
MWPGLWRRPIHSRDFEIAIICALPLEAHAVKSLFDNHWEDDGYSYTKAPRDPNAYSTGVIGRHNVVLAHMPDMGKANAASVAAHCRASFEGIKLALVVGVCGGVPVGRDEEEILLGDVIISTGIIQYDFGRQFPDGFIKKEKLLESPGRPNTEIRAHLAKLESGWDRRRLQDKTSEYLTVLRKESGETADYPGAGEDRLFKPAYRHKHQNASSCATCAACQQRTDPVCNVAMGSTCEDLGCDSEKQLPRRRLEAVRQGILPTEQARLQNPMVHFGLIASGDKVIKCGEIRDAISERNGVIAFEMEGAGVWDNVPCVVIKGVCDYADCHKNKKWQNYAAATAAACMKAFLEIWTPTVNPERNEQRGFMAKLVLFFCLMTVLLIIQTAYHKWDSWLPVTQNLREEGLDATQISSTESYWTVPFGRNKDFVGRGSELVRLVEELRPGLPEDDCQRIALVGLGGVGKTQIALEASFRIREQCPDCSVFWVPATDTTSFEGAYRDIGRKLQVEGIEGDKADVKLLVKAALSQERAGKWLLVVDNADDMELLYGEAKATNGHNTTALARYLPFNRKGSILFTTRNRKAAVKLAGKNLVSVDAMSRPDALKLLETSLAEKRMMMRNTESTTQLLDLLANLPLAIRQASAYMNENQMSTTTYLEIYRSDDDDMIHLLSQDFEDLGRYENVKNPIAMTWLVSFREILRHDPLAADYLRFMCFLAEQDIPQSLLAPAPKAKMVEAIGTLKAYAFLTEREDVGSYDIHRLVQVSVRSWLKERGEWNVWITKALQQLANEFPFPIHENRNVWVRYLPHAQYILELRERSDNEQAERDLLFKVGCSYRIIGKYKESEIIYRQTLELKKKVLGREHPDTLNSMNNLAVVLGNQGKYEEAEQIFRQTLELKEKVLGREHPDTLISMNNLAGELGSQGKYEEQSRCIGRRSS